MLKAKRGISSILFVGLIAVFYLAGCAESGTRGNAGHGNSEAQSESGVAPLGVDIMGFAGDQCLNIEELFSFLTQESPRLYARKASHDFSHSSLYRVRRNFILKLASGNLFFEESTDPKFEDFSGIRQEGCEKVLFPTSLGGTKEYSISSFGPDFVRFVNSERDVEYRVQVIGKDSFRVMYSYNAVDFQCRNETNVKFTYEETIRLAERPQDFPNTELISNDYLKLLTDSIRLSQQDLDITESSDPKFVHMSQDSYRKLLEADIDSQVFTCNEIPVGGRQVAREPTPRPVGPTPDTSTPETERPEAETPSTEAPETPDLDEEIEEDNESVDDEETEEEEVEADTEEESDDEVEEDDFENE